MNCRIVTLTCLLAWNANTGFCQEQTAAEESKRDLASQPTPNEPTKIGSGDLADTLFEGEWKLNSTKLIFDGIHTDIEDARYPKPDFGWIKDGKLNIDGDNIEFKVVKLGDSEAVILTTPHDAKEDAITIKRTTHLLFVTVILARNRAAEPADPKLNVRSEVARHPDPPRPEGMVFEFWRVDPNRKSLVQRMESLGNLITELELSGTSAELKNARQELQDATAALKRMDTAPEIASLRNRILQTRKSGDHERADQMEQMLSMRFSGRSNETQTKASDSSEQQTLLKQINAAKLELDQFSRTMAPNHSRIVAIKQRLATLESLLEQNESSGVSAQRSLKSKAQLEQTRDQLLVEYDEAEQHAIDVATAQKPDGKKKVLADQVTMNHQRLTQAVQSAFTLQQQLQDVRLQLAELDLQELRSKHERRAALAEKVVERRVQQLQRYDETSTLGEKRAEQEDSHLTKLNTVLEKLYPKLEIRLVDVGGSVLLRGTASASEIEQIVTISEQFYPAIINQIQNQDATRQSRERLHPTIRKAGVPSALNNLAPYSEISIQDLGTLQVMTDEADPLTKSDVAGKYLNRRLKRGERITRDMLVDAPLSQEIVNAYLKEALAEQEVFQKRGFPPRTYPDTYQSVLELPYGYDPEQFQSQLPDWTAEYLSAVLKQLGSKDNHEWKEREFRLLWSLEPLVFNSTRQLKVDLQPLATLLKNKVPTVEQFQERPDDYSVLWTSDLVLGMYARLNGQLPDDAFKLPILDKQTAEQLELLKTMCANQADFQWIRQEQVRLAGLLKKAPLQALKIVMDGTWHATVASNWLYAMSTRSQYRASRSSPSENCPPPVDPVLMVLTIKSIAGESDSIDRHLASFLTEAHPARAFRRHLEDLLSSNLSYRDSTLKALAIAYQHTDNKDLKTAIKKVAPAAAVIAEKSLE